MTVPATERRLGDGIDLSRSELYEMYAHGDIINIFYHWGGANPWLFSFINQLRGHWWDSLMILISKMSEHKLFVFHLMILLLIALIQWLMLKTQGKSAKPRMRIWLGVFAVLLIGYPVNGLYVHTLKEHFAMPRPYVEMPQEEGVPKKEVFVLEPQDKSDDYRSLPSGHVAYVTFLVLALWPLLHGNRRWLGIGVIGLVGISRISLGVHFPADVLAAFLFSAPLIMLVRVIVYRLLRQMFGIVC